MNSLPSASDRTERVADLNEYDIVVDREREAQFDDLACSAALACDAPMAAIALLDVDCQRLESKIGFLAREQSSIEALCSHICGQREALVVPDVQHDSRWSDPSGERETAGIRSYVGIPLVDSAGRVLGALCVFDRRSRRFTDAQIQVLRSLASSVVVHLELRCSTRRLASQADSIRGVELRLQQAEGIHREGRLAAEQASRAKSLFLASLSHELRTPLTSILGLSETLQQGVFGELNEKQERSLGFIESSGRQLLELIDDLLDLAKLEAGRLDVAVERLAVKDLCQDLLAKVQKTATQKKIRISSRLDDDELQIESDPQRIRQVLLYLLDNAIKFTPEGGTIDLRVESDPPTESLSFIVEDSGIGIDHRHLSRLFQPFEQLNPESMRQLPGRGLGLAVGQRLTARLGGSMHVESRIGQGSRFTVTLPLLAGNSFDSPLHQTLETSRENRAERVLQPSRACSMVVVDDSENFFDQLSKF